MTDRPLPYEVMDELRQKGYRLESFPIPGGEVHRIRSRFGDYITDQPQLPSGRGMSGSELQIFLLGFAAGRSA